jgi:GntR family transcriptional regulator, transcriptional repressor for pyruvate dehydrogenase complex
VSFRLSSFVFGQPMLRNETDIGYRPPAPGNLVFQVVLEHLKQRIRSGEWLPGQRLPSISRLASDLDVSTGSLREALRSLESAGVVRIEHGRGVFISGERSSPQLASHFQDDGRGLFVALAEARRLLEPELAALAAERGSSDELLDIVRLANQTEEEARQGSDFVETDILFHRKIAEAAHNPVLQSMIESFGELLRQSRQRVAMEPALTKRTVRYHMLLAEAISERNAAQARLLMLAHMNDMVDSVLAIEDREGR